MKMRAFSLHAHPLKVRRAAALGHAGVAVTQAVFFLKLIAAAEEDSGGAYSLDADALAKSLGVPVRPALDGLTKAGTIAGGRVVNFGEWVELDAGGRVMWSDEP